MIYHFEELVIVKLSPNQRASVAYTVNAIARWEQSKTKRQTGMTASHSVTCQPINHYPKYKAKSVSLRTVGEDVLRCFLRTVHCWDVIQLDQP